jgi:hypothetical protein
MFTDNFGRILVQTAPNTWSAGGVSVSGVDLATALNTFNGMAPDGYVNLAPPNPTTISKADFLSRIVATGQLPAIAAAAQTNAEVNVWLITAQSFDNIDLTDPETIQGVQFLVSQSLLTTAQATQILTP